MDLTPMLRRSDAPGPDTGPPPSDPELEERIRAEIRTAGPITFARFMEVALYDPDRGYYRRAEAGPGRSGDFLTAPEMHPLFGATLARVAADVWRTAGSPDAFAIVDYGAGSGVLGQAILEALRDEAETLASAARYVPIEINEHRLAELRRRFDEAGLGHTPAIDDAPTAGVAIANEYLDALPVHLVEQHDGRLTELYVSVIGGELALSRDDPSTPGLAARLDGGGITLRDGQRAEICLAIDDWADDVSTRIELGAVLVIDYGSTAPEVYGPSRPAGTLMAYAGHRAYDDPLVGIGRQDLTTHVDFTAVEAVLLVRGWGSPRHVNQAQFLVTAGMEQTLARLRERASDIEAQLTLRSAAGRLLDPRATGGFRVLQMARPAALASD
jgi:SAM-dependent MidA family methyltransferase